MNKEDETGQMRDLARSLRPLTYPFLLLYEGLVNGFVRELSFAKNVADTFCEIKTRDLARGFRLVEEAVKGKAVLPRERKRLHRKRLQAILKSISGYSPVDKRISSS